MRWFDPCCVRCGATPASRREADRDRGRPPEHPGRRSSALAIAGKSALSRSHSPYERIQPGFPFCLPGQEPVYSSSPPLCCFVILSAPSDPGKTRQGPQQPRLRAVVARKPRPQSPGRTPSPAHGGWRMMARQPQGGPAQWTHRPPGEGEPRSPGPGVWSPKPTRAGTLLQCGPNMRVACLR